MQLGLDFIFVGGILLIISIILLLFKLKNKKLPQRILIVFFSFTLCVAIFSYANLHNLVWLFRLTFIPNDISVLVIGPLLYLYVKSLFSVEKNLVRNILWHFIPATLSLLFIAIPTLIYSILQLEILSYVVSSATINIIKLDYIHLMLYLILALQSTSKYGKALKGNYSNLSKQDVNWVKTMLIGTLAIIAVYLAISIYELLYIDFIWYQEYLITVVMIILISYLGYYGVNQSKILFPDFLLNKRVIAPKSNRTPLSGLKRQEFESLKQKLEYVLLNQKPYLDEDLTLGKLAEQLSVKDKELSMLLNQYMRTSFFDLINKYRVDAIKKKIEMETYERYTLYGIACECGFKSRTSFNRVFKRETGLSPSDYKKKYL